MLLLVIAVVLVSTEVFSKIWPIVFDLISLQEPT